MIHIFTDSTSDISQKRASEMGVTVMPLSVSFGTETFVDGVTISTEEFYQKLESSDVLPVTSQVNPDAFIEAFKPYKDTADEIIVITIGSKLSGTYQSATIAKQDLEMDNIYIVDSEQVTVAIALLVNIAVKMRSEGKTAKEIFDYLEQIKTKLVIYAAIDSLKYLQKGGRLSKGKAVIGTMLSVKPILKVKSNEIVAFAQKRGFASAVSFMAETIMASQPNLHLPVGFAHALAPESLNSLKSQLSTEYTLQQVISTCVGSVIGTHAGPNVVLTAFFEQ